MDKIQSFARVIIGAITIYFSIKVLVMMVAPVGIMISQDQTEPLWPMLLSLVISAGCLVLLQYFGVFKPQRVVNLVTRDVEPQPSISREQWLPAAYRLVCLFAGLYCSYVFLNRAITNVNLYYYLYQNSAPGQAARHLIRPADADVAGTLILLVAGAYLLAGAPHFVRWHLKKTAQFCAEDGAK